MKRTRIDAGASRSNRRGDQIRRTTESRNGEASQASRRALQGGRVESAAGARGPAAATIGSKLGASSDPFVCNEGAAGATSQHGAAARDKHGPSAAPQGAPAIGEQHESIATAPIVGAAKNAMARARTARRCIGTKALPSLPKRVKSTNRGDPRSRSLQLPAASTHDQEPRKMDRPPRRPPLPPPIGRIKIPLSKPSHIGSPDSQMSRAALATSPRAPLGRSPRVPLATRLSFLLLTRHESTIDV